MDILKLNKLNGLPENYTGIIEYNYTGIIEYNNTIYYYLNGKYHREDGPAIIINGSIQKYYINDKNITEEVEEWIKENKIPKDWNNSHKLLFKLTFG